MQYIESRKLNLQEACMVYDVPPPVVHILDHATFSNITEQMRSMYRDTMAPRLGDVESVIDFYLRPEFYPDKSREASFALDEVLRGDFETRATAAGNLIEKGVMKPSEARILFDLPDAGKVADQLYGNAALVPLGSSVHGQQEVTPEGDVIPSPEPMGAPHAPSVPAGQRALVRSITGRVGRIKAAGGDVRAALVEEHRKALADLFDGQRADVKAQTKDLGSGWDDDLAALLDDLGHATAKAIGSTVAKSLGGSYDPTEIADWIHETHEHHPQGRDDHPTGDDDFPGTFEVVLSAPTKDRDGDTLKPEDWKQPLPDHITFDSDHGMNVATTVGSGVPRSNEETGELVVSGTYSSLPRAQEVRTLVNEGHIRTTSVAFMTEKDQKDGKEAPSASSSTARSWRSRRTVRRWSWLEGSVKAGARNSAPTRSTSSPSTTTRSPRRDCRRKSLPSPTKAPATRSKDPADRGRSDPGALAQGLDAALDEAIALLAGVDASSLPAEVQQAIALLQAADAGGTSCWTPSAFQIPTRTNRQNPLDRLAAAPAKAAAPAETKAADDDELQTRVRALSLSASTYTDD
jgi:hypothetical protein